jgi:hypothetical protein
MESMNENQNSNDPAAAAIANSKKQDYIGAAIPLEFPKTFTDPTPILAPIRDNHSAYTAVAKSCLALNQYAGNGSSAAMEDMNSVDSSSLFHDATFCSTMSEAFAALTECIQTHDDRRAKIVACKTLALVARATYARIRHSPHLFALRDSTNNRLEDEVGTDAPMALVTCALEDADDGVAACAIQSLGMMCLSSTARPGTLVDDEFLREILAISQGRRAPYAPTLIDCQDEDPTIAQMELQMRILENVVSPRLLQLVCRTTNFENVAHMRMILPFLTASLVHLSKTSPPLIYGMDRVTYAKRWVELDFVNLVNDVVEVLLLPAMQSSLDAHLQHVAAMSAIRLVHACPHAPWVGEVCHWTILVCQEELSTIESLEAKLTCLASMVICSRAVPITERMTTLEFLVHRIAELPSTTMAPHGVSSPGLLLEHKGFTHYRRPARVAFYAEIALSFFLDGPVETKEPQIRSSTFSTFTKRLLAKGFLEKPRLVKAQDNSVTQTREELTTAFCMVAAEAGRRLRAPADDKSSHWLVTASQEDLEEWVRMSLVVLDTFAPCITWGSTPDYMEEELNLLVAAQAAYVRLVQEVLHTAGLLNSKSVSLKMTPMASPPNMIWDQMEESAAYLGMFDAGHSAESLSAPISKLMDQFVARELKGQGILSHQMRLFLLSLAADQWVQGRRKEFEGASNAESQLNLNTNSARDLLAALSPRRIFSKVVESNKSQIELYGKKKKELYKKYAQDTVTVSVACIENIALTACHWRKRFGSSAETKQILSLSVASLQGKNLSENDSEPQAPVLPVCQGAIERIQAAFASNEPINLDNLPVSPLIGSVGELKRRPIVTSARAQEGKDLYNDGYLMQLSRQIIAARIDRCLLSAPTIYSFHAGARKQNWLRLALPPLPPSRDPQVPATRIPRFSWGSNVASMGGGSDAAALTLAYSMRRCLRYDGEDEFQLMVVMRVHNTTAVEISEGLRLEVGIVQEDATASPDAEDATSQEVLKTLGGDEEFDLETPLASALSVYRHELKSGEHLTWEILLDIMPMTGAMTLHPSIVYRAIEKEPPNANWVGGDDSNAPGHGSFSEKTDGKGAEGEEAKEEVEEKENIIIPGEPMQLSPLVGLQPCPLVFFRDGCGDVNSFRFLWCRMPCNIPPLRVAPLSKDEAAPVSHDAMRVCAFSTLRFPGESIPNGTVTKLWAFMSLQGKRVLCVMAESDVDTGNYGTNDKTLHVRGDDKDLLCCLAGTSTARHALIAALAPGSYPL